MKARKKIIFVLVEGKTDLIALEHFFTKIFDTDKVVVNVTSGDITSNSNVDSSNVVEEVNSYLDAYLTKNSIELKQDICRIIHIIDTDGAFIKDSDIKLQQGQKHLLYTNDNILTDNIKKVSERNKRKRANIECLLKKNTINSIPYKIYFMSCNLEHVTFNQQNCTIDEKYEFADKFVDLYDQEDSAEKYIEFFNQPKLKVDGNYKETWNFIKKEKNSLNRFTNVSLLIDSKE